MKIGNCATTNKYDGDKKTTYWNCAVFALEDASFNGNGGNTAASAPAPAKGKKKAPASDVAMLDDDEMARFAEYVRRGGRLIILGEFALFNADGSARDYSETQKPSVWNLKTINA